MMLRRLVIRLWSFEASWCPQHFYIWSWGHSVVPTRRDSTTLWRNIIPQNNRILSCTATVTSDLWYSQFIASKSVEVRKMWAISLYDRLWNVLYKEVVKVKFAVGQAKKAQSGRKCIALLFFNLRARWGGRSTPHPCPLTAGKKARYTAYRSLGGGLRTGRDACGKHHPLWISIPGSPSRKTSMVN
jgi:hypothetical protein